MSVVAFLSSLVLFDFAGRAVVEGRMIGVLKSRRGSVKRNVFAGIVLLAAALCAHADYDLYNVVPMCVGREAEQAARSADLQGRADIDLALYSLTLHPEGRPATRKVDRCLASYRKFSEALKGTKVRPAILIQSILGHWPRVDKDVEPWMRTVDQDGKVVRFCPLDEGFGSYIDYVFTAVAKAHPAFVLLDDDVRAFSHGAECFCARHVEIFNRRHGTSYDSDGLRKAVAESRPGERVYDGFLAMQREMIEECVVGRIRRAIDAVDPSIRGGICVAGEEHRFCLALARRMAAKGQVPVMRASTGCYNERMTCANVPYNVLRMLGFAEYYRGEPVDILDEADTCPQNLWSKSARSFFSHLTMSAFVGFRGAKTWYVNGLRASGFPVTRAYTDVLAENRGFLTALANEVKGSEMCGLALPCFTNFPNWHLVKNHDEFFLVPQSAGPRVCTPFGVPFCAAREFGVPGRVYALTSAEEARRLTDKDCDRLFSGNVIVFRDAALELTKRGKETLTGVRAELAPLKFNAEYDLRTKASMSYSPAMDGSVRFMVDDGSERLSDFIYRPYAGVKDFETVSPASVLYRNRLGGTVVTVAYHDGLYGLHRYSEARKSWLLNIVDRLSLEPFAFCLNDQDVLVFERRKPDGTRLVLATNLNSEPIRNLRLRLPEGSQIERMMPDGSWKDVASGIAVGFYETAVLRIR